MYLYHCGSGDGNEESKSGAVENSEKVHRSFNDILTLFSFVTKFLTLLQVLYLQRFNHNDFPQLQTNNGSNYPPVGRRESRTGNSPWTEEF